MKKIKEIINSKVIQKTLLLACVLFVGIKWVMIATTAINIPKDIVPKVKPVSALTKQGISLINQRKNAEAIKILEVESSKGDANATFWLGVAKVRNGKYLYAGDTFHQAADMGDLWAMSVLAADDGLFYLAGCNFLGWGCSSDWNEKAIEGWKTLAEQGDPDAIYAYTRMEKEWWDYVPYYRYQRILERVDQAITNGGGYAFLSVWVYLKPEDDYKYSLIAANQGYAPAMSNLAWIFKERNNFEEAEKWANKAIQLGYPGGAEFLTYLYDDWMNGDNEDENKANRIKAYYYSVLAVALGIGGKPNTMLLDEALRDEKGYPVYDENRNVKYKIYITEAEKLEIEQQVKEFVKDITPNLFFTKNDDRMFELQ